MSSSVLYPAHLAAETDETWEIGRNQAWSTYGWLRMGLGLEVLGLISRG
jgi:hypothetical protein